AMARSEWEHDPRFRTNPDRVAHRSALDPMVAETFAARPTAEWLERLQREGVPTAPIQRVDQVLADEQVLHRGMLTEMDHPAHGRVRTLGTPIKVDGQMECAALPPPRLGEHTESVLKDLLGYPSERLVELRQSGAIA